MVLGTFVGLRLLIGQPARAIGAPARAIGGPARAMSRPGTGDEPARRRVTAMTFSHRAFVVRHTRLDRSPDSGIRLHLADEVLPVWRAIQVETADDDADLPYWAVAWAGGLAIAGLFGNTKAVAGRTVFDLASGSGLCAIAAVRAGASVVTGADIDPFATAAIELNARANGCRITVVRRDVLDAGPPDVDVVLAGDTWYDVRLGPRPAMAAASPQSWD